MNASKVDAKTIAIVGGGVSGALTAYHLVRSGVGARVLVIDPRPALGLGLAYSTPSLQHLLNVPAGKVSALPNEPNHFLSWLRENFDPNATRETFASRAVFGRYVRSLVAYAQGIEQVQATVIHLAPQGRRALLTLSNGQTVTADYVVLATGNFDPAALPGIDAGAASNGSYCHDAWQPATYERLDTTAPVTLIGTGLTAVDVLLRLRELGHRGTVTAISRHGVFPNRHAAYAPAERCAVPAGTPATCGAYLHAVRSAITGGMAWRAAIDSLRTVTNDLWFALPLGEQQRFRRHLQRRWDVVRHRMAPPIADQLEAEVKAGTLVIREGHLVGVTAREDKAHVAIRTADGEGSFTTARVINCTGPSMNYRRVASPLLKSLFSQGLVTAGPLGGGFNTTRSGAIIGANGQASSILFNLGPGRLGTMLESIAIPEIREQAVEIAATLADSIAAGEARIRSVAPVSYRAAIAVAA